MKKNKTSLEIIYNPLFKKIQIGKVHSDKPGLWLGEPTDVTMQAIEAVFKLYDHRLKERNGEVRLEFLERTLADFASKFREVKKENTHEFMEYCADGLNNILDISSI